MNAEKLGLVRGSGNLFRDLGRENADPEQLKARLAAEIVRALDREEVTIRQAQAEPARGGGLLAEVRIPMVWSDGSTKRVLQPSLRLPEQLLLLIASTLPQVTVTDLKSWSEASDKKYFLKLLRGFHKKRWVELDESTGSVRILPPGANETQALLQRKKLRTI